METISFNNGQDNNNCTESPDIPLITHKDSGIWEDTRPSEIQGAPDVKQRKGVKFNHETLVKFFRKSHCPLQINDESNVNTLDWSIKDHNATTFYPIICVKNAFQSRENCKSFQVFLHKVLLSSFSIREVEVGKVHDVDDALSSELNLQILVSNLAYEKKVFVRWCLNDNWLNGARDSEASFSPVNTSNITSCDLFSLNIPLDNNLFEGDRSARTLFISFAICYNHHGTEFWDNNSGQNYRLHLGAKCKTTLFKYPLKDEYYNRASTLPNSVSSNIEESFRNVVLSTTITNTNVLMDEIDEFEDDEGCLPFTRRRKCYLKKNRSEAAENKNDDPQQPQDETWKKLHNFRNFNHNFNNNSDNFNHIFSPSFHEIPLSSSSSAFLYGSTSP